MEGKDGRQYHNHHGKTQLLSSPPPYLQLTTSTTLVIEEWCTSSIYGLTGAMLAAIIAAVSFECLSEYLRFIRHKAISSRLSAPTCCGQPTFTCGQKLAQSFIQMVRMVLAYFMMLCVMTWNIWLLAALSVGAAVGYGAFKPLLANSISDAVVTHGYDLARMTLSRKGRNRSQRSTSWRYRTVSQEPYLDMMANDNESVFHDSANSTAIGDRSTYKDDSGTDVVWILRSDVEANTKSVNTHSPIIRSPNRPKQGMSMNQQSYCSPSSRDVTMSQNSSDHVTYRQDTSPGSDTGSLPTASRFKSTSKIISKQYTSLDRSDSVLTSRSSVTSVSVSPSVNRMSSVNNRKRAQRSVSTSSGRFKPVSQQILRHQSFNNESMQLES